MRKKVYLVDLSADERQQLQRLIHGGTARARMVNRAQILLHADEGKGDQEIAAALHTSASTVWRIRKRFTEDGMHGALHEVHAHRSGALRSVRARGSAAAYGADRVALHAETWPLAQPDGDRVVGVEQTVSGSADRGQRVAGAGGGGVGSAAQRCAGEGGLALHDGQGAHETGAPLSLIITVAKV